MQAGTWQTAIMLAFFSPVILGTAFGQDKATVPAQDAAPAQVMEQPALDLLKKMNAKLASAKSFTFRTRSSTEGPGGTGQFLTFFADSEVTVMRPNRLSAQIRGDAPPFDFYFDGVKMTAYEPTDKLYATEEAPKTIDEVLPFAARKAGILLPFEDVLYSDPYATLTKGVTSAFYAGYSVIRGARCEHLAFAAPGLEWQIWIDAKTSLPCLMTGAMLDVRGAPRFAVEFFDWKLNPKLAAKRFAFVKPAGAHSMDFRALSGQQ